MSYGCSTDDRVGLNPQRKELNPESILCPTTQLVATGSLVVSPETRPVPAQMIGGSIMLLYSAQDMVQIMKEELKPEIERRYGHHIARDLEQDNDRDDQGRPDRGERFSFRLFFLRGAAAGRGA